MTKEELDELVKRYSNETAYLSYLKEDHLAYVGLINAEPKIEWLVDKLQAYKDSGYKFDEDTDPWLLIRVCAIWSCRDCLEGFPEESAGQLEKLVEWILNWAEMKEAV